jgi:hypothetical protein
VYCMYVSIRSKHHRTWKSAARGTREAGATQHLSKAAASCALGNCGVYERRNEAAPGQYEEVVSGATSR